MPVFEEHQPQVWKCIFVVDLSQAQTEYFWLTRKKDDPSWIMSSGDWKVVVLPVTVREPNMEATPRKCSMKRQAY